MWVYLVGAALSWLFSCFPHACGGVPKGKWSIPERDKFSPRMWGCTFFFTGIVPAFDVFPTHVGVYPTILLCGMAQGFPHACGGVPKTPRNPVQRIKFSPRMWGCTFMTIGENRAMKVFPTHVGVYPFPDESVDEIYCFPHACGGVPYPRHQWHQCN